MFSSYIDIVAFLSYTESSLVVYKVLPVKQYYDEVCHSSELPNGKSMGQFPIPCRCAGLNDPSVIKE